MPGGRIEVGESAAQAVIREVAEESGVAIALTGVSGVYSDPTDVFLDPDGAVHQQLALCFHAVPATTDDTTEPRPDGMETNAATWCNPADDPVPRPGRPILDVRVGATPPMARRCARFACRSLA